MFGIFFFFFQILNIVWLSTLAAHNCSCQFPFSLIFLKLCLYRNLNALSLIQGRCRMKFEPMTLQIETTHQIQYHSWLVQLFPRGQPRYQLAAGCPRPARWSALQKNDNINLSNDDIWLKKVRDIFIFSNMKGMHSRVQGEPSYLSTIKNQPLHGTICFH